jgi:hypothetical protein
VAHVQWGAGLRYEPIAGDELLSDGLDLFSEFYLIGRARQFAFAQLTRNSEQHRPQLTDFLL